MSKCILYARFSPRRNADQCESIECQLDYCREYCKQHSYEIVGEYEDRAISGAEEDRPGLWAAIEALKRGNVLIAYKLDRLARDVYLSELIRRSVEKKSATIEIVTGCENGDTPEQKMIRQILQVFAEYERKVIAARTKAAMIRHQKNGRRMSDLTPYGWTRDPNNPAMMLRDPVEQNIIQRMIGLRNEGNSYRDIAKELTNQNITCRGGKWHHTTIMNALRRHSAV